MSRTRDARRLENLLTQRAGVPVSVTWDQPSSTSRGRRWCWCVEWMNGPTVDQVREWARDVGTLDVEALSLYRHLSARAWAVNLVRHVAAGGGLGEPFAFRYELEDRMRAMSAPDAPIDDREAARAEALMRLAYPFDENRMVDVLAAHGLAVLDGVGDLPAGVTALGAKRAR